MTKTNMRNSEEDQFDESSITLLKGQHDLQKQSLDIMEDMTFNINMITSSEIFQYMMTKYEIGRLATTNLKRQHY